MFYIFNLVFVFVCLRFENRAYHILGRLAVISLNGVQDIMKYEKCNMITELNV